MAANTRSMLAIAVAAMVVTGCQSKPAQTHNPVPNNSQLAAVPPATQPVAVRPGDPRLDPSAALAKRISEYAQEIGPLADRRATTQAVAERSQVQWAQPAGTGPIKLPTKQFEPTVVQLANPVIDNQPSVANEKVTLGEKVQLATAQGAMRVTPEEANRIVVAPKPAVIAADLEAKLSKRLADSPRDVWAHLDYQLLEFLRDEQVPQLDALTSLPMEDRELLSIVLDGLTNFRNGLRADNNMQLSKKVKPLLELADRLRSQADLNISAMSLCTDVEAFGDYTPIVPRFVAGQAHEAILYCEVENFASTAMPDKKFWETRLSQEATLYTESGMPVLNDKAGKTIDHSRNRRHDFYLVKRIKLPATLTIGRYLLKVTVEDQEAKRVAEQTIPVEIVAQIDSTVAGTDK